MGPNLAAVLERDDMVNLVCIWRRLGESGSIHISLVLAQ
jgi:hypothetical protein